MRTLVCVWLLASACTSDSIDSNEQARRAYLGLDPSVVKSLTLGFAGFNAANSANIPPQMAAGDSTGTLTITGQVDQGSSANKQMRLVVGMVGYSDGPIVVNDNHDTILVTYDTDTVVTGQPALDLSLKDIPTGAITGTLVGVYHLSGDLTGDVTLDLTIAGTMQDAGGGAVARSPGTTTVTGTAMQGDGSYQVMVTL